MGRSCRGRGRSQLNKALSHGENCPETEWEGREPPSVDVAKCRLSRGLSGSCAPGQTSEGYLDFDLWVGSTQGSVCVSEDSGALTGWR